MFFIYTFPLESCLLNWCNVIMPILLWQTIFAYCLCQFYLIHYLPFHLFKHIIECLDRWLSYFFGGSPRPAAVHGSFNIHFFKVSCSECTLPTLVLSLWVSYFQVCQPFFHFFFILAVNKSFMPLALILSSKDSSHYLILPLLIDF